MAFTSNPLYMAERVTALTAAFMPGASPPEVRMPMQNFSFFVTVSSILFFTLMKQSFLQNLFAGIAKIEK